MAEIRMMEPTPLDVETGVLIIGAGAGGLVTALRAREAGAEVLVLERDPLPRGSTALSAGLIPAAGTRFQAAAGIEDSETLFAGDIRRKAKDKGDPQRVETAVGAIGPALEWLADAHGLPFSVIDNFTYPGHSAYRMHGLPSRSGAELMDHLREAAERAGVDIVTEARARTLLMDKGSRRLLGVEIERPDGTRDRIGCHALVLACNGYGGNRALVAEHIPGLKDALYFGHPGNQGEAVLWGKQLGAQLVDLSGHQGHGSVAEPHGILLTWATMTEGGFQVNIRGERFSDESRGYSEQAAAVLAQPERLAYSVFDTRIAAIARQFEDFRNIEAAGALIEAPDLPALARRLGLPEAALAATAAAIDEARRTGTADAQGRLWAGVMPLSAPYCAVKITGALFHTQGGLGIDGQARVMAEDGTPFPNLFAVGGAAAGVSGPEASGYLSGNGLLTAVAFGYLAGEAASTLAL
jgi:fumarate reductase flavoprotein subunit